MDELTQAAKADRAVQRELRRLQRPWEQPRKRTASERPSQPESRIAHMPSTCRPPRPDDEFARRWFAAASSITRTGAAQCGAR